MPFYEYEYTLVLYNDILKERKDSEEKNTKSQEDKYNITGMQSQAMKNMPKGPKVPKMSMPSMPRLK
jgi:hypothetical protein